MTRIDLLTALGNVDAKHINEAAERAENFCLHSDCEDEKVGFLDEIKYIRRKIEPIMVVAVSVVMCVGVLVYISLRNNNQKITEMNNSVVTSQSQQDALNSDCVCEEPKTYNTYDEAVEQFILDAQQNSDDLPYSAQIDGVDGIYIYSLKNLPEGYSVGTIYNAKNIHYYNDKYNNADNNEQALNHLIIFNWYNDRSYEESIESAAGFCLKNDIPFYPVKNMPNGYCAVYGSYQEIYWENDGYCFKLRLPTYVGSVSTARFEYNGQNVFELEKTFYAFDNSAEIKTDSTASEEKYKCCDIEELTPHTDGEYLYLGASVTAWHPWECDFELKVSVYNTANTTSLANFVLTERVEDLCYGEGAELRAKVDCSKLPENTTISCKVITYYNVDDAEHQGISKYLGSHSYKKQNQELDGNAILTVGILEMDAPHTLFEKRLAELQSQNPDENITELTFSQKLGALSEYGFIGLVEGHEANENLMERIVDLIENSGLSGEELDDAICNLVFENYYIKIGMTSGTINTEYILDKDGKHILRYNFISATYRYYDDENGTYITAPLNQIGISG